MSPLSARAFLVAFLFAAATQVPPPASAKPPEPEVLDTVWAGHPVGFDFITRAGKQFVVYYDAQRRITLMSRTLGADGPPHGAWTRTHPEGWPNARRKRLSTETGWDSHNSLKLEFDSDNCLHLAGNMHVDPLIYYRSEKPLDITTLKPVRAMIGDREENCTYPVFIKNAAGELVFRYRDGRSGAGADIYNIYDVKTRSWRRLLDTPLTDGGKNCNAYSRPPALGPDGFYHLLWMWRNTPDAATNHTLSYARSRDLVRWEDSNGKPLALPITPATGEIIDAAKPGQGLINTTFSIGFDAQKRPFAVYHRYDAAGKSQLYAARKEGSAWVVRQLTRWDFRWQFGGGGTIPVDVRVGRLGAGKQGRITIDYWTRDTGDGRLAVSETDFAPAENPPPEKPGASKAPKKLKTPSFPKELYAPEQPGMQVRTLSSEARDYPEKGAGTRYLLRWETLPSNRDRPRAETPPPSELRLYELR